MINITKNLNVKILLVFLIVCISIAVWVNFKESRKSFFHAFLPMKKIYIMVKGSNLQKLMNLEKNWNTQDTDKQEELEIFSPLNGQIILKK